MLTLSGNMFTLLISLIVHLLKSVEVPWVNVVSDLQGDKPLQLKYTLSLLKVFLPRKKNILV